MIKTLGFGMSALAGPALLTGAILYASAPEAQAPLRERAVNDSIMTESASAGDSEKAYKDYGVVWSKL